MTADEHCKAPGAADAPGDAAPDRGADTVAVSFEQDESGALRARLDNGCYVAHVPGKAMQPCGGMRMFPVISEAAGARHLSQYLAVLDSSASMVLQYPGSDVVAFVQRGNGIARIADRRFRVEAETGVCIRPGEGFQFMREGEEPMVLTLSVCPPCAAPRFSRSMPPAFDDSAPDRTQGVDDSRAEAMGDRFFQVLIDAKTHGTPVTQFIGRIPRSRAAPHRHLYEEAITILEGDGYLWTDETKAPVGPGDTIFLPMKQRHSLECLSPDGMRLMGVFFPSMSPASNY